MSIKNLAVNSNSSIPGIRLGTTAAGIKHPQKLDRHDVTLIEMVPGGTAAAVFTKNAFCAAPVTLARCHLTTTAPRYLLINSGNANAGTGEAGLADASICCNELAKLANCDATQVLPFSTGVIGEPLPVARLVAALPNVLANLEENNWQKAATAIMTTDTVAKQATRSIELTSGHTATITGIAKGAGMICPNMATMLAFLATDLAVASDVLQQILHNAVATSFNAITVDGDTSTNDACVLLASGVNPAPIITNLFNNLDAQHFAIAVNAICYELATAIIKDAEGATKLVTIEIINAFNLEEAKQVAYAIAHSPLVKTALFASDPNWGRILAAIGRAGINDFAIEKVRLYLNDVCIVQNGGRALDYTEQVGREIFSRNEFTIKVDLGRGIVTAKILTCDLSYDYVRINAEYRT